MSNNKEGEDAMAAMREFGRFEGENKQLRARIAELEAQLKAERLAKGDAIHACALANIELEMQQVEEPEPNWRCEKCHAEQFYFTRFCLECRGDYTMRRTADAKELARALTDICDEIDKHTVHTPISATNIAWFKRKAREALAAHRKGGGA